MKPILHHCDHCGEILDMELHYPVFSYMGCEELIFCDTECRDEFIDENTKDMFICSFGRLIEN